MNRKPQTYIQLRDFVEDLKRTGVADELEEAAVEGKIDQERYLNIFRDAYKKGKKKKNKNKQTHNIPYKCTNTQTRNQSKFKQIKSENINKTKQKQKNKQTLTGIWSPQIPKEFGGQPPEGGFDAFHDLILNDELTRIGAGGVTVCLFVYSSCFFSAVCFLG